MKDLTKNELNALLELLKRHAKAVSQSEYIETLEAMQAKLDTKERTKEAASDTPYQGNR